VSNQINKSTGATPADTGVRGLVAKVVVRHDDHAAGDRHGQVERRDVRRLADRHFRANHGAPAGSPGRYPRSAIAASTFARVESSTRIGSRHGHALDRTDATTCHTTV
jgi:hypothetical protein